MLLHFALQCCARLRPGPLPAFSDVHFFHHGLLSHHTALKRWEQFVRHGWYQLCPKQSSLPKGVTSPAFDLLPLGASEAILTRVTVQLPCPFETIILCPCGGCLAQKSFKTFFFLYCPIIRIDFGISLSINNNSVDIIHGLVIFARRVQLSVGIDVTTEKLVQRFDDRC